MGKPRTHDDGEDLFPQQNDRALVRRSDLLGQ